MSDDTASSLLSPRSLISFATHWGSRFGGINSFNEDLLSALGLACPPHVQIVCVVLDGESESFADAAKNHVTVLSLNRANDPIFSVGFLEEALRTLSINGCTPDSNTVWLGHDIITGHIAVEAAKTVGRSALIHHMSYADYEAYAETAGEAFEKETKQRDLFRQGHVVLAVGPTLRNALHDLLGRDVTMLIPGLAEITPAPAPETFTGFLSGRISEETRKIKQAHLGIAGFADAIKRATTDLALPDSLQSQNNPTLKVYGLSADPTVSGNSFSAEADLKHFAEGYSDLVFNLRALPFTSSRRDLFEDLRRASVALMPSWHEGFGLVAWESIAAGIPLIISKKSGVYRLLDEWNQGIYTRLVYAVNVRGKVDAPYFHPEDLKDVSDCLIQIAKTPQNARKKAAQLREGLLAQGYSWQHCARSFLAAIDWNLVQSDTATYTLSPVAAAPEDDVGNATAPGVLAASNPLEIPGPTWSVKRGLSSSQLLRAEEAIIPFDANRLPILTDLVAWAKSEEFLIAIRLVTGAGGAGKTRLALEMCGQLDSQGWWVGFLPDGRKDPLRREAVVAGLKAGGRPALIIIDYAETRTSDLFFLVKPFMSKPPFTLMRVLLLARSGGEWWERLEGRDPNCEALFAGRATSGPFELPALYDTLESREAAFQSALHLFGDKLQRPIPDQRPNLTPEFYSQPLLIQMSAMMALYGEHAQSAEGLVRSLVNHERRYWANLLTEGLRSEQAAQLMTLSTLANGLQIPRTIEDIWKEAGCGTAAELRQVFNELKQLYPGRTGLEGLRPDLLGEALVAQVILSNNGDSILDATFRRADARIRHQTLTVLARILRYRADIIPIVVAALASHYSRAIMEAAAVSCETSSPLPNLLETVFDTLPFNVKLQVSGQVEGLLREDLLPLSGLALRVSNVLLQQVRRRTQRLAGGRPLKDQANLAVALSSVSIALHRCGNDKDALEMAKEAEAVWQRLASIKPDEFASGWAGSLTSYANRLSNQGRYDEALPLAKQALDIQERLAKKSPERFEPDWAVALNNYANHLREQGRYEEVLPVAKLALEIRERLAKSKPERFEPDWAAALNNYASHLSDRGHYEEALPLAREALNIRERLAKSKPERFEPELATALDNYANRLSEQARHDEALPFAKRALDIRERLAKSKPERFEPDWAMALNNYASHLNAQGRHDEVLPLAKQALEVYDRLAKSNPERFDPDWAMVLGNYANALSDQGRYEEALPLAKEAVEVYKGLTKSKPERFEPDWAEAVNNYVSHLIEHGHYEEALPLAKEALEVHERLAAKNPERFEPELARALNNYAIVLSQHEHYQEALRLSKRALGIFERLAKDKRVRFGPDLAVALNNYCTRLSEQGRYEEASPFAKQALDIRMELARNKPERFEPDWARALNTCADVQSDQGRYEEALVLAKQALGIRKRLAEKARLKYVLDYRRTVSTVLFLEWLNKADIRLTAAFPPAESDVERLPKWAGTMFGEECVMSFVAEQDGMRLSHAEKALAQWRVLRVAEKRQWELMFFLACAITEKYSGRDSNDYGVIDDWRRLYQDSAQRREGHMPRWFVTASERLNLALRDR